MKLQPQAAALAAVIAAVREAVRGHCERKVFRAKVEAALAIDHSWACDQQMVLDLLRQEGELLSIEDTSALVNLILDISEIRHQHDLTLPNTCQKEIR